MGIPAYEGVHDFDPQRTYADLQSRDEARIIPAILSISWHEEWRQAQAVCMSFAHREEYWLRKNGITGLGHIARIHGTIDVGSLIELLGDLTRAGVPASELDAMFADVMVFVAQQGRRNI